MWNKPISACGWSGDFSRGYPVFAPPNDWLGSKWGTKSKKKKKKKKAKKKKSKTTTTTTKQAKNDCTCIDSMFGLSAILYARLLCEPTLMITIYSEHAGTHRFVVSSCIFRRSFKKLVHHSFCTISHLHEGDAYAVQSVSKTDRLGILLTGT